MQDPDPTIVWYTPEEMEVILSPKSKTKNAK
jgi:hypothetical protein